MAPHRSTLQMSDGAMKKSLSLCLLSYLHVELQGLKRAIKIESESLIPSGETGFVDDFGLGHLFAVE